MNVRIAFAVHIVRCLEVPPTPSTTSIFSNIFDSRKLLFDDCIPWSKWNWKAMRAGPYFGFSCFLHLLNSFVSIRSRELTAEHKLLAVLRFMSCGNFQQTAGDYIGIAQNTLSMILPSVCNAILRHMGDIIRMPRNEQECLAKAAAFAEIDGFPRCIGAIDCTHVKIASPGGEIVRRITKSIPQN